MISNYFKHFYDTLVPLNLISDLSSLLPEPEDDINDSAIKRIVDLYKSHNLENDEILIKFWIMSGFPMVHLIKFIKLDSLSQNSRDWIIWDTKIRGDTETFNLIPEMKHKLSTTAENAISSDLAKWEHWLLQFDPKTYPTEEIRHKSFDKLNQLQQESVSIYKPLFRLYTEIHKEFSEIPNENHIVTIDKILGDFNWIELGSYWQSTTLYEFARIQTDFSDISGANETIQEIKNISWNNPYFLGLVLRLEAKINYLLSQQEDMDHLFQSSQFFFKKIENKKDYFYNVLLQSSYWSSKSKKRSLELLDSLNHEYFKKMNENWLLGFYYSNLAKLKSAFENHSEANRYYEISASYFKNTIDKLNFWRNYIDHGFNLYVLEEFDEISNVINQLKDFKLPTMFEFRVAYLNAITQFRNSDIESSIKTLETSVQEAQKVLINPQLPWFYSLLAEIYRIQGKWFLSLDYFILAMKSYFHLNEAENALKVKITTCYLQLLLEKNEVALKSVKEILTYEQIDESIRGEVYWFLVKYFYLFRHKDLDDIADIVKKFENEIEILFTSEFLDLFKELLRIMKEKGEKRSNISQIHEILKKINTINFIDNFKSEWIVEIKILLLHYLLGKNNRKTEQKMHFDKFLSDSGKITYPDTITDNKLSNILNLNEKEQLSYKERIECSKYLIVISTEKCIFRNIESIFPLKLY